VQLRQESIVSKQPVQISLPLPSLCGSLTRLACVAYGSSRGAPGVNRSWPRHPSGPCASHAYTKECRLRRLSTWMCHTSPVRCTDGCSARSRDLDVCCERPSLSSRKTRRVIPPAHNGHSLHAKHAMSEFMTGLRTNGRASTTGETRDQHATVDGCSAAQACLQFAKNAHSPVGAGHGTREPSTSVCSVKRTCMPRYNGEVDRYTVCGVGSRHMC
jgi:hypothetical protein